MALVIAPKKNRDSQSALNSDSCCNIPITLTRNCRFQGFYVRYTTEYRNSLSYTSVCEHLKSAPSLGLSAFSA
jgi:hypothetical protein